MEHQVQQQVVGLVAVVVKDTGLVDHNLPVLVALVVAAMEQKAVEEKVVLQTPEAVAVVEIMVVVLDMVAVVLVEYLWDHTHSIQDLMQ
tara:strand:- start:135 stop:401 length:267 start_codon:yes stop_codon:yes gene_type:complete